MTIYLVVFLYAPSGPFKYLISISNFLPSLFSAFPLLNKHIFVNKKTKYFAFYFQVFNYSYDKSVSD